MSKIYGTLSSNGQVWLVNPAGIMVGPGGLVDTAVFVASTLKVRPEDFLAGRLNFQATAGAGDVINQGTIKTPLGGSVYLVGTNVSNESVPGEADSGVITTPGGETILAAGATINLIDTATPGVKVEITGAANNATNLGTIVAEAGRIGIAGSIVRNSGTLNASSVSSDGGRVFLKASQDTYVDGSGRIVATGTKGGQVEVLGNRVAVMDNASIDASGTNGGGTILVGGDYQGRNPDVQNAYISYFGPNARLKANATDNGNGGKVIVWADDTTRAYGSIEAKGGPNGGNGGFVETSGHRYLDFDARVSTSAPHGSAGMLLLDPANILITDLPGATDSSFMGQFSPASDTSSTLRWSTIASALTGSSVTVTTSDGLYSHGGGITFNQTQGPWYYSSGYTLTFEAVNISGIPNSGYINLSNNGVSTTIVNQYGGGIGDISFIADGNIFGNWWTGVPNTAPFGGLNISTPGKVSFVSSYQAAGSYDSAINLGNGIISAGYATSGSGYAISLQAYYGAIGVGHLRAAGGGDIEVVAGYSIWNNVWNNPGDYNYYLNGGTLTLTSIYGSYNPSSCIDGCSAISATTIGTPSSITASVTPSAQYGGINIRHGGATPTSISLMDQSTYKLSNYVEYEQTADLFLTSNHYFTSYGGGIYVGTDGNLTADGAMFNGWPAEIGMYAGNTLTINQPLRTYYYADALYPMIALAAGSTVTVDSPSPLISEGDIGIIAGASKALLDLIDTANSPTEFISLFSSATGTININSALIASDSVGMTAGNINVGSGGVISASSTTDGIFAHAGSTITIDGYLGTYGNIFLAAGSGIDVNATGVLSASYNLGLLAGGNININGGQVNTSYGSIIAGAGGDINVLSGGQIYAAGSDSGYLTADVELLANNININDGLIEAGGNIYAYAAGNITLSNGSQIWAGDDVLFSLVGANSTLYLNPTAGMTPSYIVSDDATGIPATIYLEFLGRSSGGVVIDGVETTASTPYGSGLFVLDQYTPATPGYGLVLAYANTIDPCALSPELCKPPEPPAVIEPIIIVPSGDCSTNPGSCAPKPDDTAGGSEGEFGDDGKSKGKRKAAQCKG
jgi:hypothetical protein